jgi:hypothetical protein
MMAMREIGPAWRIIMMPGDHGSGEAGAAAAIEATAAMEGANTSTVEHSSAAAKSAAVKRRAAAAETTAAEMAATSAMMATATMSTTSVSAPAMSAADFDQCVGGGFGDRQRRGIDWRKRFRALRGRYHQHRRSRDTKRLRQTALEIWNFHHA